MKETLSIGDAKATGVEMGLMTYSNVPSVFDAIVGLGWPSSPCH